MGTISRPNTYTASTTILSSEVNDDFDTIYNEFNGNISSANLASNSVTTAKIADSNVTTAKINDNAVTAAKLADDSVFPANLNSANSASGSSWAWASWTPTWTGTGSNPAIGNGTIAAAYAQIGKTVHFRIKITMGSTTTYGSGSYRFSLPVTSAVTPTNLFQAIGLWGGYDTSSGNNLGGPMELVSTTTVGGLISSITTAGQIGGEVTTTAPVTWANGDIIWLQGIYEAA